MRRLAALVLMGGALAAPAHAAGDAGNDYPTVARADYVFGCMAGNGQTRDALERCSCSIDVIASVISYDDYVKVETLRSVVQAGGEKVSPMRNAPALKALMTEFRRAQAEAEIRCF